FIHARISRNEDWLFVSITVEMPDAVLDDAHPPVGIDVGLNRLATLSDGRRYENQRPLSHLLNRLRRLNKELARRTKGGKNWHKTKSKLARLHYRIACLRADLLHKLTTEVAKTSGLVAVKDLHVKGLLQNRCLSRSFSRSEERRVGKECESERGRQHGTKKRSLKI